MFNRRIAPCKCRWLEGQANHPDSPVRFDAELNEYHFVHRTSTGAEATMMIYHCPFCGGRAPQSRRSELFHRLTRAEQGRLDKLTKHLRTIQQVEHALGKPDIERPQGTGVTIPERKGQPESTYSYDVAIYTRLSETADVWVTIYPNEKVGIHYQAKPLKTHDQER